MVVCPFNASHHVLRQHEREHLLECKDKRMLEIQKFNEPLPGHHGYLNNPTVYGSSMIPMQDENISLSGTDFIRLDESISSVSNLDRSIANRSRIDGQWRRGTSRVPSSERDPPISRSGRQMERRFPNRSPSPALEGSRPGQSSRRTSPSPMRFGDTSGNSSRSFAAPSYGTSYKSYN